MIPADRLDDTGKLIPFGPTTNPSGFTFKSRGIRDGSGGRRNFKMGSVTRSIPLLFESQTGTSSSFWNAMVWLMGAANLYTNGSGKTRLSRLMPFTDQEDVRLAVTEVGVKGLKFTQDGGFNGVPIAEYNALDLDPLMETVPFGLIPDGDGTEYDRYVQELPDVPEAKYLNLPGAGQQLRMRKTDNTGPDGSADGTVVPYNTGFVFVTGKIKRKWFRVPRATFEPDKPLFQRLYGVKDVSRPYIGSCNATDFMGFSAGTIVLLSAEREPVYDQVSEDWCYNVTYTWDWLPNGANYTYYFGNATHASGWFLATRGNYAATPLLGDEEVLHYPREHRDIYTPGAL